MDEMLKTQRALRRGGLLLGVGFGLAIVGVGVAVGLPFVMQLREAKDAKEKLPPAPKMDRRTYHEAVKAAHAQRALDQQQQQQK
jgi:hypothetical protein